MKDKYHQLKDNPEKASEILEALKMKKQDEEFLNQLDEEEDAWDDDFQSEGSGL